MKKILLSIAVIAVIISSAVLLAPANTISARGSDIAELGQKPIEVTETKDGVILNNSMFKIEFTKNSDVVYDSDGNLLISKAEFIVESEKSNGKNPSWQKVGKPTDLVWRKVNKFEYEVTRYYEEPGASGNGTAYGTAYAVVYKIKSGEPVKMTIHLQANETNNYRILWSMKGIPRNSHVKDQNRMTFEDLTVGKMPSGNTTGSLEASAPQLIVDWSDVQKQFGNITEARVESQAGGKKLDVTFDIGIVEKGKNIVIDPYYEIKAGTASQNERSLALYDGALWTAYYSTTPSVGIYVAESRNGGATWDKTKIAEYKCSPIMYRNYPLILRGLYEYPLWVFWSCETTDPPDLRSAGEGRIEYARLNVSSGEWELGTVDDNGGAGFGMSPVSAAVDSNGNIVVVLPVANTQGMKYRIWHVPTNETVPDPWWGSKRIISSGTADVHHQWDPYVAVESKNHFHVVWTASGFTQDKTSVFYQEINSPNSSVWPDRITLDNIYPSEGQAYPELALGTDGTVYAVWLDFDKDDICYRERIDGSWQDIEILDGWAPDGKPSIALDRQGTVYVTWKDTDNKIHIKSKTDGEWTDAQSMVNASGKPRLRWDNYPELAKPYQGYSFTYRYNNKLLYYENEQNSVDLELFIDEADEHVTPSKQAGNKIRLIAVVENLKDTTSNITVQVNASTALGSCLGTTIRNSSTQSKNQVATSTSVPLTLNASETKDVIWEFEVSDSHPAPGKYTVNSSAWETVMLLDRDEASFWIVEKAKAIIVSNKQLLRDYGYSDVVTYLQNIQVEKRLVIDGKPEDVIVYFVDEYDETTASWTGNIPTVEPYYDNYSADNHVNNYAEETAINDYTKANVIDNLIEEWARASNANYLLIVGDDRIIPMYRWDDPENEDRYSELSFINGYLFTDNPYADLDEGRAWETGRIELAVGRIVGTTAEDMINFIDRGIQGNAETAKDAIMATHSHFPLPQTDSILYTRFDLVDLRSTVQIASTKQDVIDVLADDTHSVYVHSGHGSPSSIRFGKDSSLKSICAEEDVCKNGVFYSNNRPFMYFDSCNVGFISPEYGIGDSLTLAIVRSGASGIIASTSYSYGWDYYTCYSQVLTAAFFSILIPWGDYETIYESNAIGDALRLAKSTYSSTFPFLWTGMDKKTVTGFQLYGVPWATLHIPYPGPVPVPTPNPQYITIEVTNPKSAGGQTYEVNISINVTDYDVIEEGEFEIISMPNVSHTINQSEPVIPYIAIPVSLPAGATNITIVEDSWSSDEIGNYSVPSINISIITVNLTGGGNYTYASINFTDETDVTGFYPTNTSGFNVSSIDEYQQVYVLLALAQFNPDTQEVKLCNTSTLKLRYETPITIAITDFWTNGSEYAIEQDINASVRMFNAGSANLTGLQVNVSLVDMLGKIEAYKLSSAFNVSSGEYKTVSVLMDDRYTDGAYSVEMSVVDEGELGNASKFIRIASGEILEFSHPDEVITGDNVSFEITFDNKDIYAHDATGWVYIYKETGIRLATIPFDTVVVNAGSNVTVDYAWETVGVNLGNYTVSAMMRLNNGKAFGPVTHQFQIVEPPWYHDDWELRQQGLVTANSTTGNLSDYQMKLMVYYGNGVSSGSDIYLNQSCLGNFSDIRFTGMDGETPLSYWIEKSYNSSNATVWVNFSGISTAGSYFYIYYDNPAASSESNGSTTFQFFDDFNDGNISTEKWTEIYEDNGDWVKEEDGVLKVLGQTSGFTNRADIWSGFIDSDVNVSVHAKVKMSDPLKQGNKYYDHTYFLGNHYYYADQSTNLMWRTGYTWHNYNQWQSQFPWGGVGVQIPSLNSSYHDLEQWVESDKTGYVVVDGTEYTKTNVLSYNPSLTEYLRLRIKGEANTDSNGCIGDIYVDYIFVREYYKPEPTFGDWGEEEGQPES